MARFQDSTLVLEAAQRWRSECLLNQRSVFTEDSLWTHDNAKALEKHYSLNLDLGEGDFFQKLESQMADAPHAAIRLLAEVLWVMYLIVSSGAASGATKRLQIRKVFAWSGDELPEDHPQLGDVLDAGVAHPGTAYNTHRWRELVFFIEFLVQWTQLGQDHQQSLLDDPWAFSAWLDKVNGASRRQLPHILCFLLFPDTFERIASGQHKERILNSFADQLPTGSTTYSTRTDVDQAVFQVREKLESEYGSELDFYATPAVVKKWRPDGSASTEQGEATSWIQEKFSGHKVWLLSAGEGGRLWPDFLKNGVAAIGWDYLGDLSDYATREDITEAIAKESGKANPKIDSLALWEFSRVMEEGDTILVKRGIGELVGHGVVQGAYEYEEERSEYCHSRRVEWTATKDWKIPSGRGVTQKTLTDFTKYPEWVRDAYGWLEKPDDLQPHPETYSLDDALKDLFLPKEDLQDLLDTLAHRKNAILQGPPGVGKTFVAQRVAYALIGKKAPGNTEFVQFHQSYSYEDFVQGFRPREEGGFELRDGTFLRFCRKAADCPDEPHVFIIDEINRGNLSRIFGELLMLIEADKRDPEYGVRLTYSPDADPFHVPPNLHLLGMMNTADRSLAIVDYALRRRFAFHALKPAYNSEKFGAFLLDAGVEEQMVRTIDDRMGQLNKAIREDEQNLGQGFEIGHSYFVPSGSEASLDERWYRMVVRTQILPLVTEYWFDRPELISRYTQLLGVS